ncbi:hypothetical protein M409DRAFT_18813 [Zasmidium cellare ATCC 36951]|uniref:Enoyl reductase (ER) domain-containing protein n=1 Tax=Zasmidium cellare ATCC 36951 TaxID=1080233 RepID=A0A6A6CUR2_ZASCE|nr:uncharacterized protein M409DRAFT_18813 [Zasmidium cellare ATCC 36951]KAF2170841.1 hypothetical protein M409DRAFT_18813 [Zasmidium cellare ATCC 36951]
MTDATPPSENTAPAISSNHELSVQRNLALPTPAHDELLIRVIYSGINPADIKHKALGIVDTHLGYDFCGVVHRLPPFDSGFAVGDVVAGTTPTGYGGPKKYGTHQDYLACPVDMAFKIPPNLPVLDAACICVTTMTAADILVDLCGFEPDDLGSTSDRAGRSAILIWGASTGVGNACVQFARALGIKNILATASPARHALLQDLGATHVFDYNDSSAVARMREVARNGSFNITHAIDAVGTTGMFSNSATLTKECCVDHPSAVLVSTVVRPFDKGFKMPLATKNKRVDIRLLIIPSLKAVDIAKGYLPTIRQTIEPDHEAHNRMWSALLWAEDHYGERLSYHECKRLILASRPSVCLWKSIALQEEQGDSESKNLGRKITRRSRLAVTMGPYEKKPTGRDSCISKKESDIVEVYATPGRGIGHALGSLVSPVEVTAESAYAINQFFNSTAERMYPVHLGITIEAAKIMWLQVLFVNEASYHCHVALMQTCNEVYDSNDSVSPRALSHIARSLPRVQRILNSDEALSDASIAIVLSLISQEMIRKCNEEIEIHFQGLTRMVDLRGGLPKLEDNRALTLKICK